MEFHDCGVLTHPRDMTRQQLKDALYDRIRRYRRAKFWGLRETAAHRRAALAFLALAKS